MPKEREFQKQFPFLTSLGYQYISNDNQAMQRFAQDAQLNFRTTTEKEAFIQRTLPLQERFLVNNLSAYTVLDETNQELLKGRGKILLSYDKAGKFVATSLSLVTDPAAGDNSPQLSIGLVGDVNKFDAGESNYMTHLAVMYTPDRSITQLEKSLKLSRRSPSKLASINPTLDPLQFDSGKWSTLKAAAKERVNKLLQENMDRGTVTTIEGARSDALYRRRYQYSYMFQNTEFVSRIVDENYGPLVGSVQERDAFIRSTMRQQEEYLEKRRAREILTKLNETLLNGKGKVVFGYGRTPNKNGDVVSTSYNLVIDPSIGKKSPEVMIALIGDTNKFNRGNHEYMTHLAIATSENGSNENVSKVLKQASIKAGYLTEVSPNLDPNEYSSAELTAISNDLESSATKITREAIANLKRRKKNRDPKVIVRRGIAIASGVSGAVGAIAKIESDTHIVEKVIDHFPH